MKQSLSGILFIFCFTISYSQCGDTVDPTASNPVSISVDCIGDVPSPDPLVVTDEADNSGVLPVVAFVIDAPDGLTCPGTIMRTYSVTDTCGNTINVSQIITIDDNTVPTASNPDTTFTDIQPASDVLVVDDEADNCTVAPVVAFVFSVSDGMTCPEIITNTYSITDDCGNQILVIHIIVIGPDPNFTVYQDSLTANNPWLSYQWLDCDNSLAPIPGATNQTYIPHLQEILL